MADIKKIAGINLAILLLYMVLINVTSNGYERQLAVLVLAAFAIGIQVVLNFLIAIVLFIKKRPEARSFLLSAVLVLVIGFSSCFGSAMI